MPVMRAPFDLAQDLLRRGLEVRVNKTVDGWEVSVGSQHFLGLPYQKALGVLYGLEAGYRLGRRYTAGEIDGLSTTINEIQGGLQYPEV
jgi:hypothetical protein